MTFRFVLVVVETVVSLETEPATHPLIAVPATPAAPAATQLPEVARVERAAGAQLSHDGGERLARARYLQLQRVGAWKSRPTCRVTLLKYHDINIGTLDMYGLRGKSAMIVEVNAAHLHVSTTAAHGKCSCYLLL